MSLAKRLSSKFHSCPRSFASRPTVHFSDNLSPSGIILQNTSRLKGLFTKYHALVLENTVRDFNIKCPGKPIPISNEIKLLGETLSSKLKIDYDIACICRKVTGQVNALSRLVKNILRCKTTIVLLFYHI